MWAAVVYVAAARVTGLQVTSVEEIILIIRRSEVILCTALTAEGFTVADLLKVVQAAGDTLIAVAVESVQIDAGSAVHRSILPNVQG